MSFSPIKRSGSALRAPRKTTTSNNKIAMKLSCSVLMLSAGLARAVEENPQGYHPCKQFDTCEPCLNSRIECAWVGGGCERSCDSVPDAAVCYHPGEEAFVGMVGPNICAVAGENGDLTKPDDITMDVAKKNTTTGEESTELDHVGFADDLTAELYGEKSRLENDCTSALGVSMAMSLAYPAAISDTEVQMRSVLGYPSNAQDGLLWDETSTDLADRFQGRCYNYNEFAQECGGQEPLLAIANSIFVDYNVTLNATYQAVVGDLVQQMDFASEKAGAMVNQWANETTNGLIDSIVEEGSLEDWFMVALNSIYLKASWKEQFNEDHTNEDLFYSDSETTNNAHFMHKVEKFPYSHEALPGFQVLQMHFSGDHRTNSNGLSMIFALPLEGGNTTAPFASSANVMEAIPSLERTRVALALPKFQYESKYEKSLRKALQSLGMEAPFDNERIDKFCLVDGRCDAFIDLILQKTFIDVNEKGVEAAAVTALGFALLSAPIHTTDPILFQADRPFQFFLYDEIEELILFEGRVGNPGIAEGSVAANTNKHADNFFQNVFGTSVNLPPAAEIGVDEDGMVVGMEDTAGDEPAGKPEKPVPDAEVATSKTQDTLKQEEEAVAAPAVPVAETSSAAIKSISRTLFYVSTFLLMVKSL